MNRYVKEMMSLTRTCFLEGQRLLKAACLWELNEQLVHLKPKRLELDPTGNRKSLNVFRKESGIGKDIFKDD